jgi:hypothetical protein
MRNKLIAIAALIAGPILIFSGLQDRKNIETIEAEGISVPAVIDGGETKSRKGVKSFKLEVRYRTQSGEQLTKTFTAPRAYVQKHVDLDSNSIIDDRVEVRYLAADPSKAVLVGAPEDPMTLVYIGIAAAVGGLGGTIYLFRKRPSPEPVPVAAA